MNYENMSDFEINKAVAKRNGLPVRDKLNCVNFNAGEDGVSVGFGGCMRVLDYCNNPSDAWAIIIESRIAINPYDDASEGWFATTDTSFFVDDKNPLRAAMIVYLMMQESK